MKRFQWEVTPKANPENCVVKNQCRITVLTPNLLRLEYSPSGQFADLASQMAFHRDFPACAYESTVENGILTVQTEALKLTWKIGAPFAADTLSVKLLCEPASTWNFGEDFEDLGGTTQTLDEIEGSCPVERGVCSRNGFSVLDDSNSLLLLEDGDISVRPEGSVDCYFFGYGFDYVRAVQDLYRLTGKPPLLPAYALGNWWSRYYAYEQQEYLDLMDRFKAEDMPFSVGVVDMDWHITKIPEEQKVCEENARLEHLRSGWTGCTWNTDLFPDYKQFLKDLHARNLKTSLNLHPASGVCPHEVMYPQMAKLCGIDPASKQRIPLNVLSQEFMAKYFDVLHHPYEEDGVDFWWMDWQQGTDYWWIHEPNQPGEYADPRERMDPLWILNHLHILDIARDGKRPMFFSRYSGPGSHRYPVGFSGDTYVTWESLQFQPQFTAMASNIGYSWWSHDIGGHTGGEKDDELYLRWLEYGVFSPINRLHSTRNPWLQKEPWVYAPEIRDLAGKWLRLRHSMFPYLYTMNYRNHIQLLPLVQPMYYSHPKCHAAYEVPNQFWFGSELVVAPITEKCEAMSKLAGVTAWLPKGNWFDFFNGLHYASRRGRKLNVYRTVGEMPVFAKAGAIVPMAEYAAHDNSLDNSDAMSVLVFPGANNRFVLYEDAGDGLQYAQGEYATTRMQLAWSNAPVFSIEPAQGKTDLIPAKRTWRIGLRGFHSGIGVDVTVNGTAVTATTQWEAATNTLWVCLEANTADAVSVAVFGENLFTDNAEARNRIEDMVMCAQYSTFLKKDLISTVDNDQLTLRAKHNRLNSGRMAGNLGRAITELLTLTADRITGSEWPE